MHRHYSSAVKCNMKQFEKNLPKHIKANYIKLQQALKKLKNIQTYTVCLQYSYRAAGFFTDEPISFVEDHYKTFDFYKPWIIVPLKVYRNGTLIPEFNKLFIQHYHIKDKKDLKPLLDLPFVKWNGNPDKVITAELGKSIEQPTIIMKKKDVILSIKHKNGVGKIFNKHGNKILSIKNSNIEAFVGENIDFRMFGTVGIGTKDGNFILLDPKKERIIRYNLKLKFKNRDKRYYRFHKKHGLYFVVDGYCYFLETGFKVKEKKNGNYNFKDAEKMKPEILFQEK